VGNHRRLPSEVNADNRKINPVLACDAAHIFIPSFRSLLPNFTFTGEDIASGLAM
jgi:hypothetical protein